MGYIYHADGTITKVQITDNLMVEDPYGNVYVVDNSTVYPNPPNVSPTGGSNAGSGKQILVNFIQQPDMPFYGFDSHNPTLTAYQNCYQQIKVNRGNYYVPWVSVPAYTSDVVAASVNLNNSNIGYGQVNFKSATGPIVAMPTSTDSIFNLAVQGAEHGSTTTYEAFYTDSVAGGRTADIVAGQVNVVAYNPLAINVCIVGVNGTVYPYDIGNLKAGVNRVLQQAVTTAQVSTLTLTNVDWDIDNNKNLSNSETGLLSSYNAEMKRLRRAVKQNPNYNPDTYYLFILPASNDATLAGYMPLTGHFGFIFTQPNNSEQKIIRTISHAIRDFCFWQQKQISRVSPDKTITVNAKQIKAQLEQQKLANAQAKGFIGELGHGAFNLWHTFSSNNQYIAEQGTTNNLMDYTPNPTDSKLHKYQWDLIHNPEIMVGWLQDEEEGEMFDMNMPESAIVSLLGKIRNANKESKDTLNLSFYQLSKGSAQSLEIAPSVYEYLEIITYSGGNVLANDEALFDPLMINPSSFTREECDAPKDLKGEFMKFTFKLYSPKVPTTKYEKTDFDAVEIIINSELEYYLEAYLLNKEIPKPGDQFLVMEIVPSGSHGNHGGLFGCTRTQKVNCCDYTGKYENPGVESGTQFHSGIDVKAPVNTSLRPALSGTVIDLSDTFTPGVYFSNSLGNKIIVRSTLADGSDVYIMYCHLNAVNVNRGDKIKVGQIIGLTGDTGNAGVKPNGERGCEIERLHVHIEASRDGVFYRGTQRIDPGQFITTKFDRNGNEVNDSN